MPIFIFLHVLTMFIAVAMGYGPAMMMIAAGNNVRVLRGVTIAGARLQKFVPPAFMLGIAFGVVAIFAHGFNPFAPWLLIAYALVAAALVITLVFTDPWLEKVAAAVESSPDEAPSAELRQLLGSPRNRALLVLDAGIVATIIADMVLKPFS